ncbi:MAG: hypothetical protein KGL38_11365 [Gemmatimonadota bacterium]|nr:hypothetical protein [Gemmatimonadota bacterium]MDE3172939.1 hypothetical protein [Gemmatimonadota bacterium]
MTGRGIARFPEALGAGLLVAGVPGATPLHAQAPLSLGGYFGVGNTSGSGYVDHVNIAYGADVDVRALQVGATRLTIGMEVGAFGTETPVVTVTSAGGASSTPDFPAVKCVVATAGVRHHFGSRESVEFGAGFGSVREDRGLTYPGLWWAAGVSERLTDAWSVVLGVRNIQWTHGGNTLHAYPITVGLRID